MKDNTTMLSGLMFPVIALMWASFAGLMVWSSVVQGTEITDQMVSVLGILGGPALLIINSVIESWKARTAVSVEVMRHNLMVHDSGSGGLTDDEE